MGVAKLLKQQRGTDAKMKITLTNAKVREVKSEGLTSSPPLLSVTGRM